MTLQELIRQARIKVDDTKRPYLRSDEAFTLDANEAQSQAARRSRLIVDSTSPLCRLDFAAGDESAKLDPRIIRVRRVRWEGRALALQKIHRDDMDRVRGPGWEDDTAEEPTHHVVGMDSNTLRPYPTPSIAGRALLTVVREPLKAMEKDGDTPEIAPRYHYALVDWMRMRYYGTEDSETRNAEREAKALAAFELEFGPPSSAQNEIWAELQEGFDPDDGSY